MTPTHPPTHVELSEADVRRYVVEANRTARILGTLLPLAMLVVGAPVARGMLTAVTGSSDEAPLIVGAWAGVVALVLVGAAARAWRVGARIPEPLGAIVGSRFALRLHHEGMVAVTEADGEAELRWRDITMIHATASAHAFVLDGGAMLLVPHRAVADVAALRHALEPWREHVTGEAA